ncbi:hypothetical protein OpiT1DRAFT_05293 [Opitutaceae bacterium TAV1]|nr:hypothetical protein OpiT1DRAFT_05293 [Opitutaceae bacterium TAV1]
MDSTTNDTTPSADADEAAVLAAAQAADNGTTPAPAVAAKPADKDQPPANASQAKTNGTPAVQGDDANAGKDGKDDKDSKPDGDKSTKPDDDKSESAFTKAQKEKQRRDDSWKALNEEKAALRQQQQAVQAEISQLRQQVAELSKKAAAPAGPVKDEHGHTAETYEGLAKKYDEEGQTQLAQLAREKAAELRVKATAAAQPAAPATAPAEAWKTPEFQAAWKKGADEIVAKEPELANADNPVFKRVNALVNDQRWRKFFLAAPEGIHAALEVAKLQEQAARVDGLNTELTKAKAEIDRLNKLVQPLGGQPGGAPAGAKKLEDMNEAEAEAHVLAMAAAADRAG